MFIYTFWSGKKKGIQTTFDLEKKKGIQIWDFFSVLDISRYTTDQNAIFGTYVLVGSKFEKIIFLGGEVMLVSGGGRESAKN